MHRLDIDSSVLDNYKAGLQQMLINAMRILRIAVILVNRRKDNAIPEVTLSIEDEHWVLNFEKDMKVAHPLIQAELTHECWLQHKAGWQLRVQ
jgi:exopolyphosphatase/guanosine-5'-triphosphate,3'-diphosphate pyrophosphatase